MSFLGIGGSSASGVNTERMEMAITESVSFSLHCG